MIDKASELFLKRKKIVDSYEEVTLLTSQYISDPMQQVFIFETSQQLEQIEQSVIKTESLGCYPTEIINEIFRIMHTIKSSAAMMLLNNMSTVAHSTEDLFYFIRENNPQKIDFPALSDIVLEGIDFMKLELEKIKNGDEADGRPEDLIKKIKAHLDVLKKKNKVTEKMREDEPAQQQFYISANVNIKM